MTYYYNPLEQSCKSERGAIARASELTLRIFEQESGEETFSAKTCALVLWKDGETATEYPLEKQEDCWVITLKINEIGLYFYYFRLDDCFLGKGSLRRGVLCDEPESWQLTVYDEDYTTPEWMKGGIMYQIFPDRFAKSGECPIADYKLLRRDWGGTPHYRPNEYGKILNNDFFGGNFKGIIEKLDYLKSLNVSVLYFNPIFEAYSNHRYDTGDYFKIDRLLGTVDDFDTLVKSAKERGMRIVLDGVFNHTGDDSRYFNKYGRYKEVLGAHQSPDSPYFDWYHFHRFPDNYESWWGIDTLPSVNEHSLTYQNFIFGADGVLKHWLSHGIDGYRIDVADELPDFFVKKMRTAVKESNPDAIIIGEVWEDASNKIAYSERREYLQGYELDSVMNYPLMDGIISFACSGNTTQLRECIALLIDNYPKQTLDCLMNILGTHDTTRILTRLGNGRRCATKDEMANTTLETYKKTLAKHKLKMAAVLQFMLPGVPCIYYGDENGMEGYIDPFNRRCFDWERMDEDLISFYQKLGDIRRNECGDVCKTGDYREIYADASCLVFERRLDNQSVTVFVNASSNEYSLHVKDKYQEFFSQKVINERLQIKGNSYGILVKIK